MCMRVGEGGQSNKRETQITRMQVQDKGEALADTHF